jgi:predicted phosphoadenosine phosphosulfate sulfurtransferase
MDAFAENWNESQFWVCVPVSAFSAFSAVGMSENEWGSWS